MEKHWIFACVCILLCQLWRFTIAQSIDSPPTNHYVPAGFNGNATFSCVATASAVIWQVNEAQLDTDERKQQAADCCQIYVEETSNGQIESRLLIAIASASNVMVRCIAVGANILVTTRSDPVIVVQFDQPQPPANFKIAVSSQEGQLTLSWDPPPNAPDGVENSYDISVVTLAQPAVPYPGFPLTVMDTTVTVLENATTECTAYAFSVIAQNEAGTSDAASFMETIPLSPNIDSITESLRTQTTVSFDGNGDVNIALQFPSATTCSDSFTIPYYLIVVQGESLDGSVRLDSSPTPGLSTTLTPASGNLSGLAGDQEYSIMVRVCTEFSPGRCDFRNSGVATVVTTDVLSAEARYIDVDNRVLLTCNFNEGSQASGCRFKFSFNLQNRTEPEVFNFTRDGGSSAQRCVVTENRANTYDLVEVLALDGFLPQGVVTIMEPVDETGVYEDFTAVCPLPVIEPEEEEASLSDGEISATIIVIVVVVIIVAVCVVAAVIGYFLWKHPVQIDKDGHITFKGINLFGINVEEEEGEQQTEVPIESQSLTKDHEAQQMSLQSAQQLSIHSAPGSVIPPPDQPITAATALAVQQAGPLTPDLEEPPSLQSAGGLPRSYPSEALLPGVETTLTPMTWVPGSTPAVAELIIKDLSNIRLRINPKVLKRVILKRQRLQPEKAKLPIALYPEPVLQPSTQSMATYL